MWGRPSGISNIARLLFQAAAMQLAFTGLRPSAMQSTGIDGPRGGTLAHQAEILHLLIRTAGCEEHLLSSEEAAHP